MPDKTIHVYPSPKLPEGNYLPGIGEAGADLPTEEAEALLAAGLVVKTKPRKSGDVSPGATGDDEIDAGASDIKGAGDG